MSGWRKMWPIHIVVAKSFQSCPTLCDPIDGSPPGSCVHGILQARVLEWVAVAFTNALKWKVKVKSLSCVWLLATPWTAPTRLLHPWDSPGKSTGVGCHCLLLLTLFNHKKAWRTDTCYDMDESQKHGAQWRKSDPKCHISYDSTCMKYPEYIHQ